MYLIKTLLAVTFATAASPCTVKAQEYDAYVLRNTTKITVYYQFAWGEKVEWKNASLLPGQSMICFNPIKGNNRMSPYLRFYRPSGAQAGTWTNPIFMSHKRVTDLREAAKADFWYYPDTRVLMLATLANSRNF